MSLETPGEAFLDALSQLGANPSGANSKCVEVNPQLVGHPLSTAYFSLPVALVIPYGQFALLGLEFFQAALKTFVYAFAGIFLLDQRRGQGDLLGLGRKARFAPPLILVQQVLCHPVEVGRGRACVRRSYLSDLPRDADDCFVSHAFRIATTSPAENPDEIRSDSFVDRRGDFIVRVEPCQQFVEVLVG